MKAITPGLKGEHKVLVTSEIAIDFLGGESARVLATPHLIGLLEMTARNSVKPFLDEGYDTVGSEVSIKHLGATPLGMQVRFETEVASITDRRIQFRVQAFDEREKVAEGTHERFIVNIAKFATRLAQKRTAVG